MSTEVVLIGHPVAHSLSPRMQNAAFAAAGLEDWTYVARDVAPEELEVAVRAVEFANVTAPYKRDVARLLGSEHRSERLYHGKQRKGDARLTIIRVKQEFWQTTFGAEDPVACYCIVSHQKAIEILAHGGG